MIDRRYVALALTAILTAAQLAVPAVPVAAQAAQTVKHPLLYLTPDCLSGEASIFVEGRNFEPRRSVDVWDFYQYSDPLYGNSVTVTTDRYGWFYTTLPVNLHQSYFHRISAIYSDDTGLNEEAYVILGSCAGNARITALPNCDVGPLTTVRIIGFGFLSASYDVIDVVVNDAAGNIVAEQTLDPTDFFDLDLALTSSRYSAGLPNGQYSITATQGTDPADSQNLVAHAFLLVPCPTITIEPVCAKAGTPPDQMTLRVTASGFIEGSSSDRLEIVFDLFGSAEEFIADAANGTFEITPYRRPNGVYTIAAKQGYYPGGIISGLAYFVFPGHTSQTWSYATTAFGVPCTNATLTVDPSCAPPQLDNDVPLTYRLTLVGSGFAEGTVEITFDADGVSQQFSVDADSGGGFTTVIAPTALAEGNYRINAHQETVGGEVFTFVYDANAAFSVPCLPPAPVLTSDLPCAEPMAGVPAAYQINLTGSGFLPGRVDITFDAGGALPEVMPPAVADDNGLFSALITPTGRGPDSYTISARQQVTGSGTVVENSVSLVIACEAPVFAITPDSGPRGFVVMVVGDFFPHDADILLRWSRGIGVGHPSSVHTDANGHFSRQLLIFNSDFLGQRELSAELATDPLALAAVPPVAFDVTMGTVSPPFGLAGNPFAAPGATIVLRR